MYALFIWESRFSFRMKIMWKTRNLWAIISYFIVHNWQFDTFIQYCFNEDWSFAPMTDFTLES